LRAKPLEIDEVFVSRLFMGALSGHEQRVLVARLLSLDRELSLELLEYLRPFEIFDHDLMGEYARILESGEDDPERVRRRLLERALDRQPELEAMISGLKVVDLLQLGDEARILLSWSAAEVLLERCQRPGLDEHTVRVRLYLALMMIDAVDLLGAAGHSPHQPVVIADLRRRLFAAISRVVEAPGA